MSTNDAAWRELTPVDLVLHCPACGKQHLDVGEFATRVHRKHLCENTPEGVKMGCGHLWKPFEYPTRGVLVPPHFGADHSEKLRDARAFAVAAGGGLSKAERDALILAVISCPGGATQDEIEWVFNWAEDVRVDAALLRLLLSRQICMRPCRDGEDCGGTHDFRIWRVK